MSSLANVMNRINNAHPEETPVIRKLLLVITSTADWRFKSSSWTVSAIIIKKKFYLLDFKYNLNTTHSNIKFIIMIFVKQTIIQTQNSNTYSE